MNRALVPLLVTFLWLAGCAFYQQDLVLEPVGSRPAQPTTADTQGSLVVFSVLEAGGTLDPERARHSRYKILTADGKLLQTVRNDSGTHFEGPVTVPLAPGSYHVVARANGYGSVTVPVVIAANQVTTVYLECDGALPDRASLTTANAVRLPDGQLVGWRAVSTKP